MTRPIELITPLGPDVLFHRMDAREALSALSTYEIDLLSERGDIDPDQMLAQNVTVRLELPDDRQRHFNGYVTRFAQTGLHGRHHLYRAVVRPWLWFLTRTSDCRIFQEMTVPDILKQVFDTHPQIASVEFRLTETYGARTCCTQYRETDFDFVSRLMEEVGIYYFFAHADGRHTLVLADSHAAHAAFEGYAQVPFIPLGRAVRPETESISEWNFAREIQPGAYVLDDFDFEKPSVDLQVRTSIQRRYGLSDYEVFDYPGRYRETGHGEQYVRTRLEELQARSERVHASTNARGIGVGCLFELTGQPRADQNREHLVLSTAYRLEYGEHESMAAAGADCRCTFEALGSQHPFRPERTSRKPVVQGPQTAIVVGPKGDEIYTDQFGRVKVQFHWDRYGVRDENSSCWMRVSHPWAGKGWGSVSIPRIGQEVIVDFLEGDPDQPIITGRVYNAESMPPYSLPAGGVVSGLKSNTHQGKGYNEMSMDDTAGKEKITVHGQYDMNTTVEHDQTSTVHNNRTDKVDVDDAETVGNNQTQTIGVDQTVGIGSNQTITVGANRNKTVGSNEIVSIGANQDATIGANRTLTVASSDTVSIGSTQTVTVALAKAETIGAAYALSVGGAMNHAVGAALMQEVGGAKIVAVGAISSESVGISKSISAGTSMSFEAGGKMAQKAGAAFSAQAGGAMSFKSGADYSVVSSAKAGIEAASEIALTCGSAQLILKSGGEILIKGSKISINGSGKIAVDASGDLVLKGSKIAEN